MSKPVPNKMRRMKLPIKKVGGDIFKLLIYLEPLTTSIIDKPSIKAHVPVMKMVLKLSIPNQIEMWWVKLSPIISKHK